MGILTPLAYGCSRIPSMNAEYRGLSPLNILLAEDERAVAFSIAFALKCDGHKVQVVADGEQALVSVGSNPMPSIC